MRQFCLLNLFGVFQFLLAELEHLPVIKVYGKKADEQKRSQHHPQDSQTSGKQRVKVKRSHGACSILRIPRRLRRSVRYWRFGLDNGVAVGERGTYLNEESVTGLFAF